MQIGQITWRNDMITKYKNILILFLLIFTSCTNTNTLLKEDDKSKAKIVKVNDISTRGVDIDKNRQYKVAPNTKEGIIKGNSTIVGEEIAILNNGQTEDLIALRKKISTSSKDKNNNVTIIKKLNDIGIKNYIFYFDYDSYSLNEGSVADIVKHAKFMQNNENAKLRIEGYTDERGSRSYNLSLGENRALAVKYIMELYVTGDRISVVSYGEENPANSDHNETAWSKNRRVKLIYY